MFIHLFIDKAVRCIIKRKATAKSKAFRVMSLEVFALLLCPGVFVAKAVILCSSRLRAEYCVALFTLILVAFSFSFKTADDFTYSVVKTLA